MVHEWVRYMKSMNMHGEKIKVKSISIAKIRRMAQRVTNNEVATCDVTPESIGGYRYYCIGPSLQFTKYGRELL